MRGINYNHLYYFWIVAKEGSIARASEVLHLTPQTISEQLHVLEDSLKTKLFSKAGRRLVLTETGRLTLNYADEMFRLGAEMTDVLKGRTGGRLLPLSVGVVDVVPKMIAYRLLEPALHLSEPVRIICREGKLGDLLTELAMHRLDMVLADTPLAAGTHVRAFNHFLGECGITFFSARELAPGFQLHFPQSLSSAALLLPASGTALHGALMQWLNHYDLRPRIAGEFEDSALMSAFGQAGAGVFIAPSVIEQEIVRQYEVAAIGRTDEVRERFYSISTERKLRHPALIAVSEAARHGLFTRSAVSVETGQQPT